MMKKPARPMVLALLVLAVFLAANVAASVVATRIIAASIAGSFPPGGRFVAVTGGQLHFYDLPAREAPFGPPILLLHGATSNARDMLYALGEPLSRHHRVIAIDRPGHGWSDRLGSDSASPAVQATRIAEALGALGIGKVVVVGHSYSGSIAANLALDHKDKIAGLVLLSGATYPWPGGINWYYRLAATPVLGEIFVDTVMTPVGAWGLQSAADDSFAPLKGPADYAQQTAAALVLRPSEFVWNGLDVAALKPFLVEQSKRYGEIDVPTAVIASEDDTVVYTDVHSKPIAKAIPGARLTLLHGMGHQIHYTARDVVLAEIERVAGQTGAMDAPLRAVSAAPLR